MLIGVMPDRRFRIVRAGETRRSSPKPGFTLIELLVVIAIIAILAALLLPALSRAKSAGYSAKCKSNLHQIAIALRLYVDDAGKYPPYIRFPINNDPGNILWNRLVLPYASGNTNVFRCPSKRSLTKFEIPFKPKAFHYDLNFAGSGHLRAFGPLGLGLGGSMALIAGPETLIPIPESAVRVPSDMVAVADAELTDDDGDNDYDAASLLTELPPDRHTRGANAVFLDGHVEYSKVRVWRLRSEHSMQRWNTDNLPHREAWSSLDY